MAHAVGARAHLHLADVPDPVLLDRIRSRGAEDPPITAADLRSWRETIQWPDAEERALFDGVEETS